MIHVTCKTIMQEGGYRTFRATRARYDQQEAPPSPEGVRTHSPSPVLLSPSVATRDATGDPLQR